jgi:hypothetical protein
MPKDSLTARKRQFIKLMPLIASGKMTVEAALTKAGYAPSTARQQKSIVDGVRQISAMQKALKAEGVTEKALAKTVKEGLKATRIFSANFKLHEAPDFNARHSYASTAAELLGAFPPKKTINADVTLDDLIQSQENSTPTE